MEDNWIVRGRGAGDDRRGRLKRGGEEEVEGGEETGRDEVRSLPFPAAKDNETVYESLHTR